ncbi:hypothetical protein RRG08_042025 [Elysia crispata]|uniref:Uncharacterized protein n=1 Tax=Elysia crispata TaxID=231223 RepID=A0AAE1DCB4_9GAST|nr:hypothetical protein RRG08_042025 [Elysia crispata]
MYEKGKEQSETSTFNLMNLWGLRDICCGVMSRGHNQSKSNQRQRYLLWCYEPRTQSEQEQSETSTFNLMNLWGLRDICCGVMSRGHNQSKSDQ